MNTKLTLSINSKVIEQAKKISRKKGISISKMVEGFLQQIGTADKKPRKYLVDELIGVIENDKTVRENWKELRNANRDSKFVK